jgi:hypothetical protein
MNKKAHAIYLLIILSLSVSTGALLLRGSKGAPERYLNVLSSAYSMRPLGTPDIKILTGEGASFSFDKEKNVICYPLPIFNGPVITQRDSLDIADMFLVREFIHDFNTKDFSPGM